MKEYIKPDFKIESLCPNEPVANGVMPYADDIPEVDVSNWDNMWD